jgi:hypothetical protein
MSAVIIYAPEDKRVPGRILGYNPSVNTPDYVGRKDVLMTLGTPEKYTDIASAYSKVSKTPDLSAFKVPLNRLKYVDGKVVEMSKEEINLITPKVRLE